MQYYLIAKGTRRSSVHPNDVLAVSAELQKEGTFNSDKNRTKSTTSTGSVDSITRLNTEINAKNDLHPMATRTNAHRKTIKDMKKDFAKTKGRKLLVKWLILFNGPKYG